MVGWLVGGYTPLHASITPDVSNEEWWEDRGKAADMEPNLNLSFYLYLNLLVWRISGTTTKRKRLRSTKKLDFKFKTCSDFGGGLGNILTLGCSWSSLRFLNNH